MGSKRRRRRLVADGTVYGWCFWHRHDRRRGHAGCSSTLTLWRPDSTARLRLVFHRAPGRLIADGYLTEGAAMRLPDGAYLNLHEPKNVRSLLDEALTSGLFPKTGTTETTGWPLFDALLPPPP
ncbi:hypothetical protein [Streptomyces sp. NPDC050560]|uniref:hypothetical protein n=1 Tax=Streptomyces sp. NPDC050560 TaxID=3365630 RepID=UPI00378E92A6